MFSGLENTMESFKLAENMNPCISMQIRYPISEENRRSQLHQTWLCTSLILRTILTYLHFAFIYRQGVIQDNSSKN